MSDIVLKMPDPPAPPPAPSPGIPVTPTVVDVTPIATTSVKTVPLPAAVLAIVLSFIVAWHFSGAISISLTSQRFIIDWSGLAPPAPVPFVPPIPPPPKPGPVVAGPLHVTLVTDPADDSPANAPLRTALAIQAAFGSLDAHWHHLTTDDQINTVGFTKYIAKVGKPSLFIQTADGGLVFPPSKAPDTEAEIIAKIKSLRGVK